MYVSLRIEKDLTLFSSATDTVINLVKTMLSHGEEESEDKRENDTLTPETLTDAVQMKADVANSSTENITQEEGHDDHTEPCVPEVKYVTDVYVMVSACVLFTFCFVQTLESPELS